MDNKETVFKEERAMFVRDVYSPAEQKMIDEWNQRALADVGWLHETPGQEYIYPVNFRKATREIIRHVALAHDYKNPLYRDPEYAKHTRWGKIIAPPMFTLAIANGQAHMLQVPAEVGRYVGCHLGEDFDFYRPIKEGDSFHVFQGLARFRDLTPDGEQPERILGSYDPVFIYNQDDELVSVWWHVLNNVYAEPGAEPDGVLRIGYEMDPVGARELGKNVRWTQKPKYTKELADTIQKLYENEPIRGKEIRWWEDVEIGETLPPVYMGPITPWDSAAYLATHVYPPIPMNETRRLIPQGLFTDEETNISYKGFEMHLAEDVPKLIGWYSHTIVENIINSFLNRMVTNWMGDDGEFRFFRWRKFANTTYGDSIIGRGRVVRKYIKDGECLVDIETAMENIKGFLANMGPTTIKLPSKAEMLYREAPKEDSSDAPLDLNPQGFRRGDRFRVLPRAGWELPFSYPLGGQTGLVYEMPVDVDGYVYALMDNDCTGIEPRAVVGFRTDCIEKI
jgi:acyl dehydratase